MARRGHGGGHGGAWKVAYADFVTAMMALFLVLWLVGSDEETRMAVQRFFKGEKEQQGRRGALKYSRNKPFMGEPQDKSSTELISNQQLNRSMDEMRKQLKNSNELGDDVVRYEFTADGLRITAFDNSDRPFFQPGTAELTDFGSTVLRTLAWVLDQYPFELEVEGHTQGLGGHDGPVENLWILSTQRATTARDQLQKEGVKSSQFYRVAGYADRMPLHPSRPDAEENRRIAILIRLRGDEDVQKIKELFSQPTN
jgi:chemotaxis protein MotB